MTVKTCLAGLPVSLLALLTLAAPAPADLNPIPETKMTAPSAAETPRNLDTHHIFTPPTDVKVWEARKAAIRQQILFSAGLLPMPKKTPLHPLATAKIDAPDYTIENVALETRPGFYLCGNLYRPKGKKGPFPAIVNPHGHWTNGRLEMQPDVAIAAPAPGPMGLGRGNLVAIGVNLARQGHVVFAYDAVGYNDTNQVTHKFAGGLKPWLWNVSIMGLQLWDSIRVVDYLQSLPDVDKSRIGATGASGGGSQVFLLTAVDDRIKVAVPVNMISAYMQGGCLCENGPGLRVGTDNVEVGAMMAPKPMLMVAATGDWTSKNPEEEWPAIKKVYDLYNAGDHTAVKQFNYQHNYNVESREAMYAWFGKWFLKDENPEHFKEKPFQADVKAMHIWTAKHPMPANALKESELIQSMIDDSEKQLASLWPQDTSSLKKFKAEMQPALGESLFAAYPQNLQKIGGQKDRTALIIVATPEEKPFATAIDNALGGRDASTRSISLLDPLANPAGGYWNEFYTTYNQTPIGARVQQILNRIGEAEAAGASKIYLIGLGEGGIWTLLARGLVPDVNGVTIRTVVDTGGFAGDSDETYLAGPYAPGLRRAGDVRTAAMLAAPSPLCLFNTGSGFKTDAIERGYQAVGAPLHIQKDAMSAQKIVDWLKSK
jgi:dienelactone hydrolase